MSSLKFAAGKPVALPCLMSLLGLLISGSARCETNPYYIGASQTFTRESNVFKVPDQEHPKSDVISGTSIFGGVDQSIGRQRVYANASLQNNSYNRLSRLDFIGYDVMAGFDWATIERLSGSLTYSRHEGQGDFSRPEAASITSGKFVETTEQIVANVNYELITNLGLNGGVEHRTVHSSNQALASSDVTSDVAHLGLRYKLGGAVTVGSGVRVTRDKRPAAASPAGRSSTRRDLDLTTEWAATALTSLNARISVGNSSGSGASRGSSGRVTGALGAKYSPTGRLRFDGSFSRDTGTETTFLNAGSASGGGAYVDSNRVTESTRLGVTYLLTSKISLTGNYSRSDGSYQSLSGLDSDNTINRYALGAQYEAGRNLSLGCGVQRESRSGTSLTVRSYSTNSANCSVRYTLK
jgi:hypothetical protein